MSSILLHAVPVMSSFSCCCCCLPNTFLPNSSLTQLKGMCFSSPSEAYTCFSFMCPHFFLPSPTHNTWLCCCNSPLPFDNPRKHCSLVFRQRHVTRAERGDSELITQPSEIKSPEIQTKSEWKLSEHVPRAFLAATLKSSVSAKMKDAASAADSNEVRYCVN